MRCVCVCPSNSVKFPSVPSDHWWRTYNDFNDEVPWKHDKLATTYIQELLRCRVDTIKFTRVSLIDHKEVENEEGVLVYKLKSTLQRDETQTSSTLVVPPGTRGAWQAVLDAIKPELSDQRFLVIGSPGIGKSRSINHFIHELIDDRRFENSTRPLPVIVFEHRKDDCVWLFAPKSATDRKSEYEAFRVTVLAQWGAKSVAALENPDNVYIVDTGKAERSLDPPLLAAVTIYVCSPDTRHFSEWRKHLALGGTFYVPMPTPEALEAAFTHYCKRADNDVLTWDEASKRMAVVGPIPRRVFDRASYDRAKESIDNAMSKEQDKVAMVLLFGAESVDAEHDQEKPLSAVFAFDVPAKSNFQNRTVCFVSDYARQKIGLSTFKSLYNSIISNTDRHKNPEYGSIFEMLVFKLLHHTLPQGNGGRGPFSMVPGGAGFHKRGYDLMKGMPSFSKHNTTSPAFFGKNFPVIDSADARNHGYSITIARKKSVTKGPFNKFRKALKLPPQETFHLCFLSPEGFKPDWKISEGCENCKGYDLQIPSPLTEEGSKVWERVLESKKGPDAVWKELNEHLKSIPDN